MRGRLDIQRLRRRYGINAVVIPRERRGTRGLGRAWVLLCLALAAHVSDEALTGFLSVWNPTVAAIRAELPWAPLPTFEFKVWLAGLIALVAVLLCLSVFVFHGARWMRPIAYALAVIMLGNGAGHIAATIAGRTVASVHFARPAPGFYSSPLLIAAAIYLLVELRRTAKAASSPG